MTMKAGSYYIGDLCYVITDKDWNTLLQVTEDPQGHYTDGEFTFNNTPFAIYSTMYGDGTYSNDYADFPVDSGTIGCISIDYLNSNNINMEDAASCGAMITFDEDFDTWADDGFIQFGHISIDTTNNQYNEDDIEDEDN